MTEKRYTKGDYTNCRSDVCEILKDNELYCIVNMGDADKIIKLLEENEKLKEKNKELQKYLGWQDMELEEMEDLND